MAIQGPVSCAERCKRVSVEVKAAQIPNNLPSFGGILRYLLFASREVCALERNWILWPRRGMKEWGCLLLDRLLMNLCGFGK